MIVRESDPSDANGISAVLDALVQVGKRTKASDPGFAMSHYIAHPDRIACFIALDAGGGILGFQSTRLARAGNPYDTPPGWGIIGTHIRPDAARRGVGRALFTATKAAAKAADLPAIEAFIGATNDDALGYYEAMGFRTCRQPQGVVAKAFRF